MKLQIGKTLSALIKERRVTLKELSKATGVSVSTLHEWQNNRSPSRPEQAAKVAAYFEVSLHYLLFNAEDPATAKAIPAISIEDIFQGVFEITLKRVKIPQNKE